MESLDCKRPKKVGKMGASATTWMTDFGTARHTELRT